VDPAVPGDVAVAIEGTWSLGDGYLVQISRSGSGLHVRQQANVRLRGLVVREVEASFDSRSGTVHFRGIGAVHPTIVVLRPTAHGLDYAMRSEVSPGKWTHGSWKPAARA
jgi:hypothetical protein